jgi:hypothetical protein
MSDITPEHLRELGDMRRTHAIERELTCKASPANILRLQKLKNRCSHQIDFYARKMAGRPWAHLKTGADVLAMAADYVEQDEAGRRSFQRRMKPQLDELDKRRRLHQIQQFELTQRVLACQLALKYQDRPDKFESFILEMQGQMETRWRSLDGARN